MSPLAQRAVLAMQAMIQREFAAGNLTAEEAARLSTSIRPVRFPWWPVWCGVIAGYSICRLTDLLVAQ